MNENRRIAENSLILYIRLIITTIIGLYASRIVLLQLGASNFGLYAVVGGIVSILNFLNTTMIATSNRYISVELGRGDEGNLNKIFNTLQVIHLLFAIVLIVFIETIGVWYVKNYLNIDHVKIGDALYILHLSAISAAISAIIIPYQGLLTAYEKFNIRALVEVINSVLNLGIVLLLITVSGNKLRAYALYVMLIQLTIAFIYYAYSSVKFKDIVRWQINRDKHDYKNVTKFFGWQLVYILGTIGSNQGSALIMNLFFGTVVNAAFGIASKVNEFVFSFVKNLNQAAMPQIMKSYSAGNENRSLMLIYKLSKYTFFIMLIPAVPIILSIDTILVLWLKNVPPYTAAFVILRIVHALISCLESGFDANIDATGKIKRTKLFYSLIFLSLLPVIYFLYKIGVPAYAITILYIIGEVIFLIFQTRILVSLTQFRISDYISITIAPVSLVSILIIPQYFIRMMIGQGFLAFIIISVLSIALTIATIYFVGLNHQERVMIKVNSDKLPLIRYFSR